MYHDATASPVSELSPATSPTPKYNSMYAPPSVHNLGYNDQALAEMHAGEHQPPQEMGSAPQCKSLFSVLPPVLVLDMRGLYKV